jgi:hypothetical protein
MFSMTLWCIWKKHNEKLLNNAAGELAISIRIARDFLLQWEQCRAHQYHQCAGTVSASGSAELW